MIDQYLNNKWNIKLVVATDKVKCLDVQLPNLLEYQNNYERQVTVSMV